MTISMVGHWAILIWGISYSIKLMGILEQGKEIHLYTIIFAGSTETKEINPQVGSMTFI